MEPPVAAAPPSDRSRARCGGTRVALGFLAPAAIVLGVWIVYPTVYTIVRSFFGQQGFGDFIGIDNYKALFTTRHPADGDQEQRDLDRSSRRRS